MPTVDLKTLLIRQINNLDSSIDTSIGSNFRDLLINPISLILEGYQNEHEQILSTLSVQSPDELSEAELDALGSNFLVERQPGAYHTGTVKVYFVSPIPLSIPANTRFFNSSTGYEYETTSAYTITRTAMEQNFEANGYYATAEISVRSIERTQDGAISSGATLGTNSITAPTPARVEVITDINGGSPRETNTEFLTRIKNTIKTNTLASETVLKDEVKGQSNDITFVEVVGAGSDFMFRDLVSYNDLAPNAVETFEYVKSGEALDSGTKQHIAYVDNFGVELVASGGVFDAFPDSPSEWTSEFSNEMYRGVYELVDGYTATTDQYQIISVENFTSDLFSEFSLNDGARTDNQLVWPDEIRLDGADVILGKAPSPSEQEADIRFRYQELDLLRLELEEASRTQELSKVSEVIQQLQDKQNPETYANLAPVFHKRINQHTGISIETTINTNDGTAYGEMAYITVLRNDALYVAHDGYGLAYRKQPGFIVRLNNDNYEGDTELRNADIAEFENFFGVDPVANNLIGSDILRTGSGNDQYWFFNCYLVDNNALDEEVLMGANKVFDSINGINQYLQRAKVWIEPDVDYDFLINIQTTLGTTVSYKPSTSSDYTEILSKGATYPAYVPSSGEKISTGNSAVDALDSTRGHFGIGVGQTKGYEWAVKQLFVRSIIQTFPMHLFAFKVDLSKWSSSTADFTIDYWGVGYDPTQYALDGNTGNSKTIAAIWKDSTSEWVTIGTHTATIADTADEKRLTRDFTRLSDYYDVDNYIYVLASAANIGTGYESNVDHNLVTYFVQLANPEAGKKCTGNSIDVYCYAPNSIVERAASGVVSNGELIINDPYIADIIEVRELLSQVTLPSGDYQIYNTAVGETFGPDNEFTLTFDPSFNGTQISVIYRTWVNSAAINAYLNDPDNRYPAVSLKENVMPLCVVDITDLQYSGDLDVETAKEGLKDFINNIEDGTLEKSDLVNYLYGQGATFVSLNISGTLKQYDPRFNSDTISFTNDRYEIPNTTFGNFYTNIDLLSGVTKV